MGLPGPDGFSDVSTKRYSLPTSLLHIFVLLDVNYDIYQNEI
jgi:hypothetical protein